jgi:hypothetical protein
MNEISIMPAITRRGDEVSDAETDLHSLADLAKLLPKLRSGKPVNRSTVYRWATVGLKSKSGVRVRLEARPMGGTLVASLADVRRFNEALDEVEWMPPASPMSAREEAAMKARGEAAWKSLVDCGFIKRKEPDYCQAL